MPDMIPVIGRKRFFEMVYTGSPVSAITAKEWGLINEIVPSDRLSVRINQLSLALAAVSAEALGRGKRAVLKGTDFRSLGRELLQLLKA